MISLVAYFLFTKVLGSASLTAGMAGTLALLARGGHARGMKGRKADPTLVVLDTQSVQAAASVPATRSGGTRGRRCPGARGAWPWTCWDWSS
jgi:hypothetical protein